MPGAEAGVFAALKHALSAERPRLVLWLPVALMLGIGAYFTCDFEPPLYAGLIVLSMTALLLAALWRRPHRVLVLPFFLIALGFTAAQWRAYQVATPLLTEELRYRLAEGTIDEIVPVEKKEKLVISRLIIEGLPQEKTPRRVRISFRGENPSLRVGDRIRFHASLYPLSLPTMPGAYDFARYFYFQGIGANGFAMRQAEIIESNQQSNWQTWFGNLRHSIGEDIRSHMGVSSGTVAAAMTIGEMGPIPEEVKETLRDSGLAHILSISGLHLSIVTGIIFYSVRLLLALWPTFALRFSVKKTAAVFALVSALIYLLLAGSPIPAQRAFIMVSFLFVAMLLDRRGVTLRTLALTAALLLLIFPEAMFGASFQMSFAATLAIVALYERYGASLYPAGAAWWWRIACHVYAIALTSLAATLATAPFVLYHFNRFALLGLVANMVVIPLATFIIMPGMVIALLLMPLGLQAIGYAPLEFGTDLMIGMSRWVTSLPYASLRFPSPTDTGLLCAAFGVLWICLMTGRKRLLGMVLAVGGLSTIALHVPVDVFIGDDARQVMVRLGDGRYTALKGTARAFTVQNWLRSEGQEELVPVKTLDKISGVECDKALCTYRHNERTLILVKNPKDRDVLVQACAKTSDILVAWWYLHDDTCAVPAQRIGRAELEAHGAHALWFDKNAIRLAYTRQISDPGGKGRRVWQPPHSGDEEEEDE